MRSERGPRARTRSKGYATVLFEKEEVAQTAIDALNEKYCKVRNMIVRLENFV